MKLELSTEQVLQIRAALLYAYSMSDDELPTLAMFPTRAECDDIISTLDLYARLDELNKTKGGAK